MSLEGRIVVAPGGWMRDTRRTRRFAGIATLMSVAFVALFFLPNPRMHETTGDGLILGAFFFGVGVFGLLVARRLASAGFWIGPDGIVVRGPLKTRRAQLSDAQEFVPGVQSAAGNGTPCPMLTRTHGSPLGVWALGREGLVWRMGRYLEDLQPLCDELNSVLKSLQSRNVGRLSG